jgi:hypothetical protein
VPDWRWPRTGDSATLNVGGLEGNAAASSGSSMLCADAALDGMMMARLERLLFEDFMMLPLTLVMLLFSTVNASLLRMAGSMVSGISSGMAVAYTGKLYADRSSILNLGGDIVFGETGGESS